MPLRNLQSVILYRSLQLTNLKTMTLYLTILATAFMVELILSIVFTLLPKAGKAGQLLSEQFTQAPMLDLALGLLIWLPWIAGLITAGWSGLVAIVPGQILAMKLWIVWHEWSYRKALGKPTNCRVPKPSLRLVSQPLSILGNQHFLTCIFFDPSRRSTLVSHVGHVARISSLQAQ